MASLIHLVKHSGSVDHRRLRPVDDMVLLSCVVGESGFVMFCYRLKHQDLGNHFWLCLMNLTNS